MKYDIIAFMGSFLLILAYYLYLGRRKRRAPDSSVHTLNARVRERWVDMIITHDNMAILAIQTLRGLGRSAGSNPETIAGNGRKAGKRNQT